ncbi:hypothetical protein SAMN05421878_11135 [Actinobaculum suis]|uniref:Uncharacterized protein n=1 Tax=Actinobaculum suis TaxID=1657 RepID=A0A1G7DH53_9ACTO|nr:hypothetical protein SAMN05421878_11135 [Actinobaculum suis]VDG76988.1 Uncharacterised protein [Actinobaculum suis]
MVQIWLPAKNLTQALTKAIALLEPRVPMVGLSALSKAIADAG